MQSKNEGNRKKASEAAPLSEEDLRDFAGLGGLIQLGLNSADERKGKNRIILALLALLGISLSLNVIHEFYRPEPKLLSETPDGRIRPLPTLDQPLYTHKEILAWADRCVSSIYKLSYVDWQKTLQNDSMCLSDKGRKEFTKSLNEIGVFKYLNPDNQGNLYAVTKPAVMRQYRLADEGYVEWIVDVPYRLVMDGRQKGSLDVVMTMRIRRVKISLREDGLWVESYVVRSVGGRS